MASIRRHRGKWQVRWRDPAGRDRAQGFDRKSDAKRFSAEVETDLRRGTWRDPTLGRTLLRDWTIEVMDSRLHLRAASRSRDESYLRNHVLTAFGNAPVASIQRGDVQSWVRTLSEEKGLAPATVRECHRILSGILREAVESKLIGENPCHRISLPRRQRIEKRFLSPDEVERLAAATDPRYSAFVYAGAYLGCRWGELAGLKRVHLNLLRRRVAIVGSLERVGGSFRYVEETKSSAGRRTLPVPAFLADILAAHLANVPESEWVFPAPAGGHLFYTGYRRRFWAPAVARASLAPLTPHELRHTYAALLIAQGADQLTLQRRMGHRDIATTLNEYGHLYPDHDDALTDRMDELGRAAHDRAVSSRDVDQMWTTTQIEVVTEADFGVEKAR